jgi:hypothetical protein
MGAQHQGGVMNRRPENRTRRILGMTYLQLVVLFILVVILLLVVVVTIGLVRGVFDGSQLAVLPTEPSVRETDQVESAPSPSAPAYPILLPTAWPTPSAPSLQDSATPMLTLVPTPIGTIPDPTVTPPVGVCGLLNLSFLNATSNITGWRLQNDSGSALAITRIEIEWPTTNDAVFNVFLDGTVIWSGEGLESPTIMTTWIGGTEDRSVDTLSLVEFFFGTVAVSSGYDLRIWFSNGCEVSAAH